MVQGAGFMGESSGSSVTRALLQCASSGALSILWDKDNIDRAAEENV